MLNSIKRVREKARKDAVSELNVVHCGTMFLYLMGELLFVTIYNIYILTC